jgi:hypothetical protein
MNAVTRDDRILPELRWTAMGLVLILATAVVILYGFPSETERLFAWTIRPDMTPILMGSGYLSGVYYFSRMATGGRWHHYAAALLGIDAFAWMMAIATVLHWDKFNHTHISGLAWIIVYAIVPAIVLAFWWRNRRTDPGTPEAHDRVVPASLRLVMRVVGVALTLAAVAVFLVPDLAIDRWPWTLTPLTARVVAGWLVLPGVAGLLTSAESRWSGWRTLVQSILLWTVALAFGMLRARDDFDPDRLATWMTVVIMAGWIIGLILLYAYMERGAARDPAPAPAAS